MPMDFPDLESLKNVAKTIDYRMPKENETEAEYREELANHFEGLDFLMAQEIRNGVGWDKFSDEQNKDVLRRRGLDI